jgi:hypothetical protein
MLVRVGFVDEQVAELVAVVDALLGPPADTSRPGFNGSHGLVRNVVGCPLNGKPPRAFPHRLGER